MKRCSTQLIIRETQIKTIMRYHLTGQNGHHQKTTNNKCQRGCGEKRKLLNCWWEYKLIQPLGKMVWRFLKKLGIKPPYDPAIPSLGIYPEETKTERHMYPDIHCSIIYNSQDMEASQMFTYIHKTEYYSAIERNAFESILKRWMNQSLLYRVK